MSMFRIILETTNEPTTNQYFWSCTHPNIHQTPYSTSIWHTSHFRFLSHFQDNSRIKLCPFLTRVSMGLIEHIETFNYFYMLHSIAHLGDIGSYNVTCHNFYRSLFVRSTLRCHISNFHNNMDINTLAHK